MALPDELLAIAQQQSGPLSYAQLTEHGITRARLRQQLDRGWRLVLPGVLNTAVSPLDHGQRLVAAQLYAGPGAMIGGAAASRWHGITSAVGEIVAVEVPHARRPRGGGFVDVRRNSRPDPRPWRRRLQRDRRRVLMALAVTSRSGDGALPRDEDQRRSTALPARGPASSS